MSKCLQNLVDHISARFFDRSASPQLAKRTLVLAVGGSPAKLSQGRSTLTKTHSCPKVRNPLATSWHNECLQTPLLYWKCFPTSQPASQPPCGSCCRVQIQTSGFDWRSWHTRGPKPIHQRPEKEHAIFLALEFHLSSTEGRRPLNDQETHPCS